MTTAAESTVPTDVSTMEAFYSGGFELEIVLFCIPPAQPEFRHHSVKVLQGFKRCFRKKYFNFNSKRETGLSLLLQPTHQSTHLNASLSPR